MFERFTEKARRTIFWARYEASNSASPTIESVHVLLGLLRENPGLLGDTPDEAKFIEEIRLEILRDGRERVPTSTSVDLPLSDEGKRALAYGAEEAQSFKHSHIGTEHLLMGLLREEGSLPARLLRQHGIDLQVIRERISTSGLRPEPSSTVDHVPVDRKALHALVDTLPDAAIGAAANALKRMQTWPPEVPPEIAQRRLQRGQTGFGSGMMGTTGAFVRDWSGVHEGSRFSSRTEDGAQLRETRVVFRGHELTLTERLEMSQDGKQLKYVQQLSGPKREHQIEIDFDLT